MTSQHEASGPHAMYNVRTSPSEADGLERERRQRGGVPSQKPAESQNHRGTFHIGYLERRGFVGITTLERLHQECSAQSV